MLAPHKTGETTADFTGKRVLLAEDNALNAEIAVELLQSIGLKVDWAEDGQKAVEMFEKSAPRQLFCGVHGHADAGDGRRGGHPPYPRQ